MTSIEEALRSGAVRLVPVEATGDMTAAWPSYNKGAGHERSIYNAMLSASPDHTPALLALIEERDRLKVERDEADAEITSTEILLGDERRMRFAAEAKCDALREALAPFVKAAKRYDGLRIQDSQRVSENTDTLTVGDLRRARQALTGASNDG